MISTFKFEFYCKPSELFKQHLSEFLSDDETIECNNFLQSNLFSLGRLIEKEYEMSKYSFGLEFESKDRYNEIKNFVNPKFLVKHFEKIKNYMIRASKYFEGTLTELYNIFFTLAVAKTCFPLDTEKVMAYKDHCINPSTAMKELHIRDTLNASTDDPLDITIGDLCFVFSQKLYEYYSNNCHESTYAYLTSTHKGDIKLVYKTLLRLNTLRDKHINLKHRDPDYKYPEEFYQLNKLLYHEFSLLKYTNLLDDLYDFSKKVKYKFEFDDGYIPFNRCTSYTYRLPFLCVKDRPHDYGINEVIELLVMSLKMLEETEITHHIWNQTCGLLYPVLKHLRGSQHFKFYSRSFHIKHKLSADFENIHGFLEGQLYLNQFNECNMIELVPNSKAYLEDIKYSRKEPYFRTLMEYLKQEDYLEADDYVKFWVQNYA